MSLRAKDTGASSDRLVSLGTIHSSLISPNFEFEVLKNEMDLPSLVGSKDDKTLSDGGI